MKRLPTLLVSALILAGCTGTTTVIMDDNVAAPAPSATTSEPGSPAEPAAGSELATGSEPATSVDPPGTARLSAPVPTDSRLDLRDVSITTTGYALTFDGETAWEIPLTIAVPEGWLFDPELPGFSDGASSMALTAGCAGACEIKGWNQALNADGEFFDEGEQLFPDDASQGFHGRSSERGDVDSMSAKLDDGSGVSLTAHTRYDVGRFVGCTAVAVAGPTPLDQLRELCEAIELDWSVAAASTPEYVITERLTQEAESAANNPAPGLARQTVSVEGEGLISIALPPGSTVNEDGDEIELAATSIFTDLELSATCDGACGPQDWGPKLQEPRNTIGRTRLRLDLVNDSPIDGGWLISGSDDDDHTVLVVRWNDQSDRYFSCKASIDSRDLDLIDDMINICLSSQPDWSTW